MNTEPASQPHAVDFLPEARDYHTVVAARLANGSERKITGHARAKLWAQHPELVPPKVNVIFVSVRDEEEAGRLYDEFEHLLGPELM